MTHCLEKTEPFEGSVFTPTWRDGAFRTWRCLHTSLVTPLTNESYHTYESISPLKSAPRHALCLIEPLFATRYVWLRAWRGADAKIGRAIFDCMNDWVVCHVWIITLSYWLIHRLLICAITYHANSYAAWGVKELPNCPQPLICLICVIWINWYEWYWFISLVWLINI